MKKTKLNKIYKILITIVIVYFVVNALVNFFSGVKETVNNFTSNHTVTHDTNTDSEINNETIQGVREKYTKIKGDGEDEVTVMVYMIGTDLESSYGMATSDVYEMLNGKQYDNINIVLQTGGCKKWNNSVFSNNNVERWAINSSNFSRLGYIGRASMVDSDTLADFIRYSADNFPANRYMLVLWDHGAGSISGFGYDEVYANQPSMSPDVIAAALKKGGVKFDLVGFDACLMANLETAIAIEPYADYMIGSEETEPGEGWNYTNWIRILDENTSVSTLSLGKQIIDDYISTSKKNNYNSELSSSMIDLGELAYSIQTPLTDFSKDVYEKLEDGDYQGVSLARSNTKEFSKQSGLDQVDLVDLVENIDAKGSDKLVKAIKSSIKYNKTFNMNDAYGLSVYFPYSSLNRFNSAIDVYDNIDFNSDYKKAIKSFASYASSGQVFTQNSGSSSTSLFDVLLGDSYYYDDNYYTNDYYDMYDQSYYNNYSGYGYDNSFGYGYDDWMEPNVIDIMSTFFRNKDNYINAKNLKIKVKNNKPVIELNEAEWNLIDVITLNMFIDDGNGYIDLGKDNTFKFTNKGDLLAQADGTWLSVNDHVVSYQFVSDTYIDENNYKIVGYIPAYLNNQRVNLIVNFTNNNPYGTILGGQLLYENSDTIQKGLIEIKDGDEISLVANYYSYDGQLIDEYQIGDVLTVNGKLQINNIYLDNDYVYAYCLKDIYGNNLWTSKTVVNNKSAN